MTLLPLSEDQREAVDGLIGSRAIEQVPADLSRASAFMRKARIKCADLDNTQHHENRFDLAYGACHDVGEALLSAYGYRTRSGSGQHASVGRFLVIALDEPPGSVAATRFDRLRRIRNAQDYPAQPVSVAESDLAAQSARELLQSAEERGL